MLRLMEGSVGEEMPFLGVHHWELIPWGRGCSGPWWPPQTAPAMGLAGPCSPHRGAGSQEPGQDQKLVPYSQGK